MVLHRLVATSLGSSKGQGEVEEPNGGETPKPEDISRKIEGSNSGAD